MDESHRHRFSKRSRHKTVLFHLPEIQKQAKLIYGDRDQANGYFVRMLTGREHEGAS